MQYTQCLRCQNYEHSDANKATPFVYLPIQLYTYFNLKKALIAQNT